MQLVDGVYTKQCNSGLLYILTTAWMQCVRNILLPTICMIKLFIQSINIKIITENVHYI